LASVSVDYVRDVINVSSAEVPDAKVLKMIKRAEVTLELKTDREIDYDTNSVLNKLQAGISMLSFFLISKYLLKFVMVMPTISWGFGVAPHHNIGVNFF